MYDYTLQNSTPEFREAVDCLDSGDAGRLTQLLSLRPDIVTERPRCGEGYFKDPYLLWFVAGNPVREERLAGNILEMTRSILGAARRHAAESFQDQVDYTLSLVTSGRVPRESGVQLDLVDFLIDEGADPNAGMSPALAHEEVEAVERLIHHGARVDLVVAVCTGRVEQEQRELATATRDERQTALAAAALYGRAGSISRLVAAGVDVNAFCPEGFHAHATPLHQAVSSGSVEAVKVLLEAGADPDIPDRGFNSTALGWAEYLGQKEIADLLARRPRP